MMDNVWYKVKKVRKLVILLVLPAKVPIPESNLPTRYSVQQLKTEPAMASNAKRSLQGEADLFLFRNEPHLRLHTQCTDLSLSLACTYRYSTTKGQ